MIYSRAAITKVWSLWFDGEMMRINEIRLQIFLLNLNEKIYKPIFAKRICPKYLQNLQMVLSMLCNDEKTCKKFELFRYKCILKSYCLIQFFFAKEPAKILAKLSSFSVSYQLSLVLLNDHWVFCKDRNRPEVPWTRIATVILSQQSRYLKSCWRVLIRKSSFQVLFPTDFYTRQREWIVLNLVKKVN